MWSVMKSLIHPHRCLDFGWLQSLEWKKSWAKLCPTLLFFTWVHKLAWVISCEKWNFIIFHKTRVWPEQWPQRFKIVNMFTWTVFFLINLSAVHCPHVGVYQSSGIHIIWITLVGFAAPDNENDSSSVIGCGPVRGRGKCLNLVQAAGEVCHR